MNVEETVTLWLAHLKAGKAEAVEQLWKEYFDRVVGLAKARLNSGHRKVADEEDIALSVFDTFCRGVSAGKYPRLADRDNLWPLLVVLTTRRVSDRVRRERRQKRGGGHVYVEAELGVGDENPFRLDTLLSEAPTPELEAVMNEECTRLFGQLDDDLQAIALGKMHGYTNQELAERMNCGLRTIERRLDLIRRIWEAPAD